MLNSDRFSYNISYVSGICINFGILSTKDFKYLYDMQILQYAVIHI